MYISSFNSRYTVKWTIWSWGELGLIWPDTSLQCTDVSIWQNGTGNGTRMELPVFWSGHETVENGTEYVTGTIVKTTYIKNLLLSLIYILYMHSSCLEGYCILFSATAGSRRRHGGLGGGAGLHQVQERCRRLTHVPPHCVPSSRLTMLCFIWCCLALCFHNFFAVNHHFLPGEDLPDYITPSTPTWGIMVLHVT